MNSGFAGTDHNIHNLEVSITSGLSVSKFWVMNFQIDRRSDLATSVKISSWVCYMGFETFSGSYDKGQLS